MKKILLDPGHGGSDTGAAVDVQISWKQLPLRAQVWESDMNLRLANLVAGHLQRDGHTAILTRNTDCKLSINSRVALASDCDMLVSLHHNSFTDPSVGGAEIFYADDDGKQLAAYIWEEATVELARFGISDRGIKHESASQHDSLGVLHGGLPSVLIEACFLSSEDDWSQLQNGYLNRLAGAVSAGIQTYLWGRGDENS